MPDRRQRSKDASRGAAVQEQFELKGLRVAMLATGTRGEVQPMIALGVALMEQGCTVKVFTSSTYEKLVTGSNLGYQHVCVDPATEAALKEDPVFAKAMAEGDTFAFMQAQAEWDQKAFPEVFYLAWAALDEFQPQLVMHSIMRVALANMYCRTHAVPAIPTHFQMVLPTSEAAPFGRRAPPIGFVNNILWRLMYDQFTTGLRTQYDVGLQFLDSDDVMAVLPRTTDEYMKELSEPQTPLLVGISPLVFPMPKDAQGPNICCTGWWRIGEKEQTKRFLAGDPSFGGSHKDELKAFLEAGEPPVYMGWGSMVSVSSKFMTDLAVSALKATGQRGVLCRGVAELSAELLSDPELIAYAKEKVIFIQAAPHEWLLPKCSVSVIHGGSGTTAAAMASGKPTIVTPVWLDQNDFADSVARMGNGINLGPPISVTPKALADAINKCLSDPSILSKSKEVAEQLQKEDGLKCAIDKIEEFVLGPMSNGDWMKKYSGLREEYRRTRTGGWAPWAACSCAASGGVPIEKTDTDVVSTQ